MSILSKMTFTDAAPVRSATGETALDKFLNAVTKQIDAAVTVGKNEVPMHEVVSYVGEGEERKKIVEEKPLRVWFFQASTGEWCIAVRYGNRPLRITDDGKHSIVCGDFDKVLPTLKLIKKAAEAGELTDAINEAQKIGGKKTTDTVSASD